MRSITRKKKPNNLKKGRIRAGSSKMIKTKKITKSKDKIQNSLHSKKFLKSEDARLIRMR